MTRKLLWRIYGILLSVALITAGVCLMYACMQVYTSGGEQIYTAEKIAAAFAPIAIPVYLTLALVVGGFLLSLAVPVEQKKTVEKNYPLMLAKLHQKNDLDGCGDKRLVAAIVKEPEKRKFTSILSFAILGICSLGFLCYALNGSNFHSTDITQSMVKGVGVMLGCLAVPAAFSIFAAYYNKASIRREVELMKMVAAPRQPVELTPKAPCRLWAILPYGLLAVAAVLIVVGVMGNGFADVLTKAVNICRECVGLG